MNALHDEPDPTSIPSRADRHTNEYAARMVYLVGDQKHPYNGPIPDPRSRSLKPPALFMTRQQAKVNAALCGSTLLRSDTEANSSTATSTETKPEINPGRRAKRQGGLKRRSKTGAEAFNEDAWNWSLMEQAGVRFWVNKLTGEATDEYPYPEVLQQADASDAESCAHLSSKECLSMYMRSNTDIATGASVYDRRDYEEAMWELDGKKTLQTVA
eukprot:TRINITY_DN19646_c0_g1_i1.p1 TRINITY_DN19646_c0_g1~~TRINITY_DN19646_c0_g1_i1.p1  ORF type:complete len:214 (-),score=22.71 TRINITY_DN19646_c0_g1_i1:91-732(-)